MCKLSTALATVLNKVKIYNERSFVLNSHDDIKYKLFDRFCALSVSFSICSNRETCNNGSVKDIEDICLERNLNFECVDSPRLVEHGIRSHYVKIKFMTLK